MERARREGIIVRSDAAVGACAMTMSTTERARREDIIVKSVAEEACAENMIQK